jgi:hypothetical protein
MRWPSPGPRVVVSLALNRKIELAKNTHKRLKLRPELGGNLPLAWVYLALGVRSDRTDRSRSSVISKVRSSKNGDRSVSFKTQDRASSVSVSSVRSRS